MNPCKREGQNLSLTAYILPHDKVMMRQGKPFAVELERLAAGGRDDPLVMVALHTLPAEMASQVRKTLHSVPSFVAHRQCTDNAIIPTHTDSKIV